MVSTTISKDREVTFVKILTEHPTIDRLFEEWKAPLGRDYLPYRNHVYRVFNLASKLAGAENSQLEKLAVASAFHDVGIWLDETFDYLEPSIRRATAFLSTAGHKSWSTEVACMISQHHKIFPFRGGQVKLVEAFRRADWLDVCLFTLPTYLPKAYLGRIVQTFPRAGFHRRLVVFTLRWVREHPFRPLPMFKL